MLKAMFILGVPICCLLSAHAASGKLSARDAKLIIAQMPEVRDANSARKCPVLSVLSVTETLVELQVRNFCVEWPDSGLLGLYTVIRSTGRVRDVGGAPIPLSVEQRAQIQRLMDDESRASLTESEAVCAVKRLAHVEKLRSPGQQITVRMTSVLPSGEFQLQAVRSNRDNREIDQVLRVLFDPNSATAKDTDSGDPLDYADPGLRSSLVSLRRDAELSREEAKALADEAARSGDLPGVKDCRTTVPEPSMDMGDAYRFLTPSQCSSNLDRQVHLLVGIYSGTVQKADSGETVDSPVLERLRRTFLLDAQKRHQHAEEYVREHCAK